MSSQVSRGGLPCRRSDDSLEPGHQGLDGEVRHEFISHYYPNVLEAMRERAWKVVRTTPLPASGSLFLKTHPNSQWIWVDMTLNSDPALSRTICVIAKSNPAEVYKCWEIGTYGRAVHFEYNKDGTQVWVSLWGDAATPGQTGASQRPSA